MFFKFQKVSLFYIFSSLVSKVWHKIVLSQAYWYFRCKSEFVFGKYFVVWAQYFAIFQLQSLHLLSFLPSGSPVLLLTSALQLCSLRSFSKRLQNIRRNKQNFTKNEFGCKRTNCPYACPSLLRQKCFKNALSGFGTMLYILNSLPPYVHSLLDTHTTHALQCSSQSGNLKLNCPSKWTLK